MSGEYFVRTDAQVLGPLDATGLKLLVASGRLDSASEVSTDGKDWLPAAEVFPRFFEP